MKIFIKYAFIVVLVFSFSTAAFSRASRKDYFLKPQIGFWFGPITPVYKTADDVETDLGAGAFVRYNTSMRDVKFGIDTSYQHYESNGVNELYIVPVYGNFLYLLPLNLPVKFQVKAGFGASWIKIYPDNSSQWDPTFGTGIEVSFPAGRTINIALRIDYLYIYEGHIEGSKHGGHVVNAGVSLYFNLNIF